MVIASIHLFSCVVAMMYPRLIELRPNAAGIGEQEKQSAGGSAFSPGNRRELKGAR
ncbi:MAG: hypothetical protein ABSA46_21240 [Thermodesulfovibrionales bacterium]